MTRFTEIYVICVLILSTMMVNAQNIYLNKKVSLPTGQVALKVILNSLSHQTGCVFSYDPTKIVDKQILSITTKGSLSLHSALLVVLPKNIQYKMNGKYIVLQIVEPAIVTRKPKPAEKKLKPGRSSGHSTKYNGKIDKDPILERLVLPPLKNNAETTFVPQEVDTINYQGIDSIAAIQKVLPIQPVDSNLLVSTLADTISEKKAFEGELQPSDFQPALLMNADTMQNGFGDFINKRAFLETGISINDKLVAFSVRAGLYNVYSIISIGSDYHDSYLLGIGVGVNVKIDKHFSLNFDLLRNSLVAGKSYSLQVRASNSQFIPVLNYSLGRSFKIFAGPTVNLIKSSYISSISTTNLGMIVALGFSAGVKIDIKNLLERK